MFLFCVLSDLMYLCDCIGIRRTVKTGCYVIADSSIYFADAAVFTLPMQQYLLCRCCSTYFADAVVYGNIFQPYS